MTRKVIPITQRQRQVWDNTQAATVCYAADHLKGDPSHVFKLAYSDDADALTMLAEYKQLRVTLHSIAVQLLSVFGELTLKANEHFGRESD